MSTEPKIKVFTYTDFRGKEIRREVNYTLDVEALEGTPGFPLLLMAANPKLSAPDLWIILDYLDAGTHTIQRSLNYLRKRRWMFKRRGEDWPTSWPNKDGKDPQAVIIMREHPEMSLRDLVKLLGQHGIRRGKDWVMRHRCDPS